MLLTARDLYLTSNGSKDFFVRGQSNANSICSAKSCSVIEFASPKIHVTPVIMAHEIGHALGMEHDEKAGCDADGYVMSATLDSGDPNARALWSKCSRDKLAQIFENGTCLINSGYTDIFSSLSFKSLSGNFQCGPKEVMINETVDNCATLNCIDLDSNVKKVTPGIGALIGTPCPNGVCFKSTCVSPSLMTFGPDCTKDKPEDDENAMIKCIVEVIEHVMAAFNKLGQLFGF